MPDIVLLIVVLIAAIIGIYGYYKKGYEAGYIQGKHDMLAYMKRNRNDTDEFI